MNKVFRNIIVVDNPSKWNIDIEDVPLVSAKEYLTSTQFRDQKNLRIFNLCKSYRYQSLGYYVSLIALARRHRVLPDVSTIQDLKLQTIIKLFSDDVDDLIQKKLKGLKSNEFVLSIYFGRNVISKYDTLAKQFFEMFKAPFLRVTFEYTTKWEIKSIKTIPSSDVPVEHYPFVKEFAKDYFSHNRFLRKNKEYYKYDMAILVNPDEHEAAPSNDKAIRNFIKAAHKQHVYAEVISKDDYGRLAEFDALFIRETTNVHHHTYRFARKAEAEGLVVIDDPTSILKCTNKVYLDELLKHHDIPTPKSVVVHKFNMDDVPAILSFPIILKQPDSAFSQGVHKVSDIIEYEQMASDLLSKSDLIMAQEFLPSDFDWRIGVLNNEPIFACKYYMAKNHWQIKNNSSECDREDTEGECDTLPLEHVPPRVLQTALKTARLIGNGLYGVDIKEINKKVYVIEINDNPNIDEGIEDTVLKDELYDRVISYFTKEIEKRKNGIEQHKD